MSEALRVLMLEDNEQDAELTAQELRRAGYELLLGRVDSEAGFLASLEQPLDLILADYSLPQYDALRALNALQHRRLDIPFIVVTGGFEELAIRCLKQGAADYLIKDRLGRLGEAVRQALEERALREQKRRADEAARENEERYRSLFEDSRDPVMIIGREGEVVDFNYTTLLLFGYTREEMLALRIQQICADPQQADELQRAIENAGAVRNFEIRLRKKSGEAMECLVTASARQGPGGSILGYQGFFRDVTERLRAERQAQEQDRLAAVGQLAAGIAHDFNNILGTIGLYAELLRRNEKLPSSDQERLDTIIRQTQRGAALTGQVLDFSRRSVMEMHSFDLKGFVYEIQEMLSRTLPESIRLDFQYEGEGFSVEADPTRIQQMVMNLALNGRDAMPQGGDLTIHLSRFSLAPGQAPPAAGLGAGEWIALRLADTGSGIAADDMPHIFEPFFTTKAPGKGTGLGLAQVHGIVAQHNGLVTVDSRPGQGTTFTVYLPAAAGEEAGEHRLDLPRGYDRGQGEQILLVEDDTTARQAMQEILQALNYKVFASGSGEEALQEYDRRGGEIDLVLSDIVMPDKGGVELYRELQAINPAVKIVLMTGYPTGQGTRELLDQRQVHWLQKPFTTEALGRTLRLMLER
jgi:PAS domain S-box-containing protein